MKNWLRPTLPEFLTPRNKIPIAILWVIVAAVIYGFTNRYPVFEPKMLPMSWVDDAVPFIPWTVWIYWSNYLIFAVAYLVARDLSMLARYFYASIAMQLITCTIFFFWPTTFPRDLFPLTSDIDSVTYTVFSSLRLQDTPNNCFPSQHVASVLLTSCIFLHEQRRKFWFFFLWAVAICVTTVTTKQHYAADIWGGAIVALFCYGVFYHWVRYRAAKPSTSSAWNMPERA